MKPLGIERQTLLVALIPILLMTLLLESYFVYARFADLENSLLERSQMMAHQIATSSEYAVFSGNSALLQQNVGDALALQDVSQLLVLGRDARLLMGGAGRESARLAKASKSRPVYSDNDALVLYEPIVATEIRLDALDFAAGAAPAAPLGAIILEISKHRLSGQKREILLFSLAITLLVLTTALLLALSATRRITRPIMSMSQAIRRFGEGDLDTRISPQSRVLELDMLAIGFNQMARQLQQDREMLESRVAERTAALAASELEYRTLIENTPDTIARYDRDCRRSYVNPAFAAMAEGGNSTLLGKKPSESPGGSDMKIYENQINEVFATGKSRHFELKWPDRNGKEICSDIRLTAERDLSGAVTSVLGVGHDITELNHSREELQRKELAKSRFLAAAGHDLRQPLAAANLFIDTLKFTDPSPAQNKIILRLDQAMTTFNELLESLLNISKLDAGVVKAENTDITITEIIGWLDESFAPMALKKQLGFKLYFSMKKALVIRSDIHLLKSVLSNLVSNAIKYTPHGGILISARRRGNAVLFQVWDTGMGIAKENIEHIFDEFYQVDNRQRDRASGLGLGLSIGKRAIALLGGEISCRSVVGRGSVFSFSLPLAHAPKAFALARVDLQDAPIDSAFAQGKRFMVVEDDALVAQAMTELLERMGGQIKCFACAEEALACALTEPADFYITDYMLGGELNGIEFLNQLRRQQGLSIHAVLVTGDTSPSFIREGAGLNWPVLHKPISASRLIEGLAVQAR